MNTRLEIAEPKLEPESPAIELSCLDPPTDLDYLQEQFINEPTLANYLACDAFIKNQSPKLDVDHPRRRRNQKSRLTKLLKANMYRMLDHDFSAILDTATLFGGKPPFPDRIYELNEAKKERLARCWPTGRLIRRVSFRADFPEFNLHVIDLLAAQEKRADEKEKKEFNEMFDWSPTWN